MVKKPTQLTLSVTPDIAEEGELIHFGGTLTVVDTLQPVNNKRIELWVQRQMAPGAEPYPWELRNKGTTMPFPFPKYDILLALPIGSYLVYTKFNGDATYEGCTSEIHAVGVEPREPPFEERAYQNTIEWEAETTKEYASSESKGEPTWDINLAELKQKIEDAIPDAVNKELVTRAMNEGFVFSNVGISDVKVDFSYRTVTREFRDYTLTRKYAKAHINATIDFDSDKAISESVTLAAGILIALKYVLSAIVAIVVLYFVIEAVRRWLTSMTTKSYKFHTVKYDEEGNIIEETWGEGEEPFLPGIAGVGSIVIILVVILMLFMFLGRRK